MSGRRLRSSNPSSNNEEPTECMNNQSIQQFKHGDILWCRINGGSWWPVQVADEICVACKPKKIKNDQILVRLYGTFEHMYVEPVNCVSKIEEENSGNREIFQKFLQEDLIHMKSGGQSAATVSESKETSEIEKEEAPRGKGQIKGKLKRTMIIDNSPLSGSSDNPKAAKKVKVSQIGIPKRKTRSETSKARNEGTSSIEVSNETGNVNNGVSSISSFDKNGEGVATGARRSRHRKTNGNGSSPEKASQDENNNAHIEYLDAKEIKKLVAKIVKEVAEKTRNESLKGRGMESCPENSEYMKKSSEMKKMKLHISRRAKNEDIEAHITGTIDAGKPNGASLYKIRYSDCDYNEKRAKIQEEINGARRSTGYYSNEMDGGGKSRSNFAKRDEATKKLSETKKAMNGPSSTSKYFLSPRCRRVMQSLGLIAPLGSPFCRNGLMSSLLP